MLHVVGCSQRTHVSLKHLQPLMLQQSRRVHNAFAVYLVHAVRHPDTNQCQF